MKIVVILSATILGAVVGSTRAPSEAPPYEGTSMFVSPIGGRSAATIRNSYATVLASPSFRDELAVASGEPLDDSSLEVAAPPETGLVTVTVRAASAEQVRAISESILPAFQVVAARTTPDQDVSTALVDVFGEPSEPVQADGPSPVLPMLGGALAGFAVGLLGVAFWSRRHRPGVTSLAMAQEASGLPFRATVPDLHDTSGSAHVNPHDAAYAVLRAGTDRWWRRPVRLIVLVPCTRDRRVYDLAIDLVSVAQLGGNTPLLVDADLDRGGLSHYLGKQSAPGVSDARISHGRVAAAVTMVHTQRGSAGQPGSAAAIPFLPSGTGSNDASIATIAPLISLVEGFDAAVAVAPPFDEIAPIAELLEAADGVLVAGVSGETGEDELAALGDLLRSMAAELRTTGALLGAERLDLSLEPAEVVSID